MVDIYQDFTQPDKLKEGENDRYFITPPPGSPDTEKNMLFMRFSNPCMVIRHDHECYTQNYGCLFQKRRF